MYFEIISGPQEVTSSRPARPVPPLSSYPRWWHLPSLIVQNQAVGMGTVCALFPAVCHTRRFSFAPSSVRDCHMPVKLTELLSRVCVMPVGAAAGNGHRSVCLNGTVGHARCSGPCPPPPQLWGGLAGPSSGSQPFRWVCLQKGQCRRLRFKPRCTSQTHAPPGSSPDLPQHGGWARRPHCHPGIHGGPQ